MAARTTTPPSNAAPTLIPLPPNTFLNMLFTASVTLLFSSLVAAQAGYGGGGTTPATTTAPASAPPIPSAPADTTTSKNINVAAGGSLVFMPANITAGNGTTVTFWFPNSPITHSVTQSSFANPCTYLAASTNNTAGFDSGLTSSKQFTITITDDTKPIWFHCKQVTHCGMGMVGSINAPLNGTNTFTAFQAAAVKIGGAEVAETDNGAVTGGFNAVASVGPTATGGGALPSTTPPAGSGMRIGISVGAALLGGVVVLAAMA